MFFFLYFQNQVLKFTLISIFQYVIFSFLLFLTNQIDLYYIFQKVQEKQDYFVQQLLMQMKEKELKFYHDEWLKVYVNIIFHRQKYIFVYYNDQVQVTINIMINFITLADWLVRFHYLKRVYKAIFPLIEDIFSIYFSKPYLLISYVVGPGVVFFNDETLAFYFIWFEELCITTDWILFLCFFIYSAILWVILYEPGPTFGLFSGLIS